MTQSMIQKKHTQHDDASRGVISFTRQNLWRWLVPQDRWEFVEARPEMLGTVPSYERLVNAIRKTEERLAPDQGMAVFSANRLGLKYFAGATPVGAGDLVSDPARERGEGSFTKNELRQAILEAGIKEERIRWYYPYPDLDLPTDIFSDAWLPDAKTFTENAWDLYAEAKKRWQLFDEAAVGRTVAREGLFGELANAFIAVVLPKQLYASQAPSGDGEAQNVPDAPMEDLWHSLPIYVRFSHQRDPKFSIQTAIYQDRFGHRRVEKVPLSADAVRHLARVHERSEALAAQYAGTQIAINRSRWEDEKESPGALSTDDSGASESASGKPRKSTGVLHLEYVTGVNLRDLLEDLLAKGDEETFCSAVDHYFAALSCTAKQRPFLPDDNTVRVLGPQIRQAVSGEASLPVTDLDPVFSNVLLQEDGTCTLIDCEWTVTYPVPVSFLFYRCLSRFFYAHPEASALWEKLEKRYGITPEKKAIFAEAEETFQSRVKGDGVSIAEVMTASGDVGLPLADAVRYLDWERSLLAPAIRFIYADDAQDEEAARRRQEETLRKRGILAEGAPENEPFELTRDENKNVSLLSVELPVGTRLIKAEPEMPPAADPADEEQTVAEAETAAESAAGASEEILTDACLVEEVVFFPCLLPGTLTLYEITDDQGRVLPVQSPQAVTMTEGQTQTQFHYLTSDPAVNIRPFMDSKSIRIRFVYDAIIPGGVQQLLPLAGLRRNASADTLRRNTLLSELVSLRPLPDLVTSQQGRIQQLDEVVASQQGMVEHLQQLTAELTAERDRLRAENAQLAAANADLTGQIEAIENSASWKLTRPMRSVMGTLRGDARKQSEERGTET